MGVYTSRSRELVCGCLSPQEPCFLRDARGSGEGPGVRRETETGESKGGVCLKLTSEFGLSLKTAPARVVGMRGWRGRLEFVLRIGV